MLKNKKLGFSLVELMVVLAIFAIVMGIILNDAPKFRDKTSLDLVSQNIALNIRGAQVFGIGTKVIDDNPPQSFGIHFNTDSVEENNFALFADFNNDGEYSSFGEIFPTQCPETGGECLELYKLRGAKIEKVCVGDISCDNKLVDIIYTRPQSEANFCVRTGYGSGCIDSANPVSFIQIWITNTRESDSRIITVWKNGQIMVEKFTNQ